MTAGWPTLWAAGRRGLVSGVLGLGLVQALAMAAMAWGIRASFLMLPHPGATAGGPVAVIVLAGLLLALARWQENQLAERLGQRFANETRTRLFEARARSGGRRPNGHADLVLLQRLAGDMSAVRLWIGKGVLRSLVSAFRLGTMGLILAWWMPPEVAAGVLAAIGLGFGAMYLVSIRQAPVHRRLHRARSQVTRFLAERLPHAGALRIAGRMQKEALALERRTRRLERHAVGRQRLHGLMRCIPDVVRGISVAWVLVAAMASGLGTADTAACLAMVGLMIPGLRDLAGVWDRRAAWLEVQGRLQPWLGCQAPVPRQQDHPTPASGPSRIVAIGPDGNTPGSTPLHPGQKVLLQAQDAQTCRHWLHAVANMAPEATGYTLLNAWPCPPSITLVEPRSPLLGGSLRRAATFGSARRPGDARVLRVLREVGLQDLVDRLGGLDGRLGWAGEGLSEKERACLLLARAMLSRSDLVLLDALPLTLTPELARAIGRWLDRCRATVLLANAYAGAVGERDITVWRLPPARGADASAAA